MSFNYKYLLFILFPGWLFLSTTDTSGQEVNSFTDNVSFNKGSNGSLDLLQFIVEPTDQTSSGFYLFDLSNFIVIIDHFGNPIFYRYTPGGSRSFEHQPDGSYSYYTNSVKGFLLMNAYFQITDTIVKVGDDLIDFHEFNILENGNYIVLGFDRRVVDMSQYIEGGQVFATVTGMVFQELDPDKNLLFEWNSWDHISFMDSDPLVVDLTAQVIDYIHPNSIVQDTDGNFLLTSRNLSEITKIDRVTGEIIWRMGGKRNEFEFVNDPLRFSALHSAIRLPNGNIALLDNGYGHEPQFSRGVEYAIDEEGKTASLVREYRSSPDVFSTVMGNVTTLPGNHLVVGWGMNSSWALLDEYDDDGELITSISLPHTSLFSAYKVSYLDRFDFFIVPGEDTLDFEEVETGDSALLVVELFNQGSDPAILFEFTDKSGQFEIVNELPVQIHGSATEMIMLKFKPTASGNYNIPAYLQFTLNSTIADDHMVACRLMLRGTATGTTSTGKYNSGKELHIYPNPFTSLFFIEEGVTIETVVLRTIMGRKVYQYENCGDERILITLPGLPPGIYIVELIFKDSTRKFIEVVKGR